MTADTDTVWMLSDYAGGASTSPRNARAPATRRRAGRRPIAVTLAAIVVAMLVSALFAGPDSSAEPAIPFNPQAEQWKREAHLANNANLYRRAIGGDLDDDPFVAGSGHVPMR